MIKVLIVDDSAVVRKILTDELSKYNDIEIIGSAADPYIARDKIVKLHPDVLTLDLEMPRMDGLSFLTKLMRYYPMPVVVLSSFTPKKSEKAIKALEAGAVEVICKPESGFSHPDISRNLVHAIRAAASSRIIMRPENAPALLPAEKLNYLPSQTADTVIAIGASTGGTKAIETILTGLPANTPGTLIVQHMPENFTTAFADRLNRICLMEVREAHDNDPVKAGLALVAPGNRHMLLNRSEGEYLVRIKDGPPVHFQRPSVDVLFQSVAVSAGPNALGVLLTGMGTDGAKGMVALSQRGSHTLAQDEESCVVFGMPKEAIKLGAVDEVVPLHGISQAIINALRDQKGGKRKRNN